MASPICRPWAHDHWALSERPCLGSRPGGGDQAAPVPTLVVTKLDRLARSLPDARAIVEDLTRRQVKLSLGGSVHDPTDPVGRLLFNVLAMVAEFEGDLIRMRTREGMKVASVAREGMAGPPRRSRPGEM